MVLILPLGLRVWSGAYAGGAGCLKCLWVLAIYLKSQLLLENGAEVGKSRTGIWDFPISPEFAASAWKKWDQLS